MEATDKEQREKRGVSTQGSQCGIKKDTKTNKNSFTVSVKYQLLCVKALNAMQQTSWNKTRLE